MTHPLGRALLLTLMLVTVATNAHAQLRPRRFLIAAGPSVVQDPQVSYLVGLGAWSGVSGAASWQAASMGRFSVLLEYRLGRFAGGRHENGGDEEFTGATWTLQEALATADMPLVGTRAASASLLVSVGYGGMMFTGPVDGDNDFSRKNASGPVVGGGIAMTMAGRDQRPRYRLSVQPTVNARGTTLPLMFGLYF